MFQPLPEGEELEKLKALLRAGEACVEAGDYETAFGHFDAFCKQEVRVSYAWRLKGECLMGVGKFKEALTPLQEAIRLDPKSDLAWGYFALATTKLGENKLAIEILEKAENQVRRKDILAFFRGKLNEKMGNTTDALFDYVRSQLFAKNEEDKMISAESVYKILNKGK